MLELRSCADEREEQLSVDIYNAVWPHEAVTMDEVRHFKAAMADYDDLVAWIDGEPVGSGFVAIMPQRPELPNVLITVLAEARGRGAGSGLYAAVSEWARGRGLGELEAVVSDDDPDSLGFAERRGFVEDRREKGVALRLAGIDPPAVEPPEGIEIATWADRPDLSRAIYEVVLEASPDVPGWEDEIVEPYEKWLVNDMQGSGDRPEATFLALAGAEVVGYAKFSLSGAQPKTAWHDLTGIKRAWRGRGIARALKATQIPLGNGERLRGAAHPQRRTQRADPPPEPRIRLRAGDGPDLPARAARVSTPQVRYAAGSGVEIASQVLGEGPLDLVWVAGAITHLSTAAAQN